jgi:hypothetical protein
MEKPFPGSYPREQEEADNEHFSSPRYLVPLFSSLYSGASLTPLSPTVPEGNGGRGCDQAGKHGAI